MRADEAGAAGDENAHGAAEGYLSSDARVSLPAEVLDAEESPLPERKRNRHDKEQEAAGER